MVVDGLTIPAALLGLASDGRWPNGANAKMQNLEPIVSGERIKRIAPGEDSLVLYPVESFVTVARAAAWNLEFWKTWGALDEIEPTQCLMIGDFGLGSDSVIVLAYHLPAIPVLRLRWAVDGVGKGKTTWVNCAATFEDFACELGLDSIHGAAAR